MRIFLSYASENAKLAETIAVSLRGRHHTVFLDKDDLPPGKGYEFQIANAIKSCDLVVFLISPQFLAPGRFTLTELALTKQHWPNPHGRILPVTIDAIDLGAIPSYLKGVTMLTPLGNTAAEVSLAVENLKSTNSLHLSAGMALLGLVAVLISPLWHRGVVRPITDALRDRSELDLGSPFWFINVWSWVPFGIAIGFGLFYWGSRNYIRSIMAAGIIALGCSAAGISSFVFVLQASFDRFPDVSMSTERATSDQVSKDDEEGDRKRRERNATRDSLLHYSTGAVIFGAISMLAIMVAGGITHASLRNPARFLVGIGGSTLFATFSMVAARWMGLGPEWAIAFWVAASMALVGSWMAG